jgi:tetratricopeptide (TPR) repeat protein/uncharacterized membrane protein
VARRSARSHTRSSERRHSQAPRSFSPPIWLAAALIVAAGVIAYSNSFTGVFVFDDEPAIVENPQIRRLDSLTEAMKSPTGTTLSGRPVAALTFAINYALAPADARDAMREPPPRASAAETDRFHRNLWGYHAVNLLIHVVAALTLFGIVRRTLLTEVLRDRLGDRSSALALAVSLVWVVHPLTTSAVTYVVQRVESLMGLLYLLTVYCAIRAWAHPLPWSTLAVTACALGMGVKESMVTAPIAVVLWDVTYAGRPAASERRWSSRWTLYVALFATWVLLGLLVSGGHRPAAAGFAFADWPWWRYLLTQAGVIVHYLRLAFVPWPLVLDYGWPASRTAGAIAVPLVFVVALIAAAVWLLLRRRPSGFPAACFFLVLAPTSSVLPIVTEVAAEHRMYLPLAAIVSLVIISLVIISIVIIASLEWLRRLALPRLAAPAAVATIVVACAALTIERNVQYKSFERIWLATIHERPANARARNNYATALLARGRPAEAEEHLRVAVDIDPRYAEAQAGLGVALAAQGRYEEGIAHLRMATTIAPGFSAAQQSLGEAYAASGRMQDAVTHYARALEQRADDVVLLNRIGWILATDASESLRDGKRALTLAERAVALTNRDDVTSLDTLAAAQAELGRFPDAAATCREALEVARRKGERDIVPELEQRLALYQSGQPFRQP